ncbi:hypothetical protein BDZ45DRAFT_219598 [Acephala macrosclerotiorum]|nr:hypothetical protein BDZ45DRAFT_219598 [Acephala macrosclerotiorum]
MAHEFPNEIDMSATMESDPLLATPRASLDESVGTAPSDDQSTCPTPPEYIRVELNDHQAACKQKIDYLLPRIANTPTSDPIIAEIAAKAADAKIFYEDMEHLMVNGMIAAAEAAERVNFDNEMARKARKKAKRRAMEEQAREDAYVAYAKDINKQAVINAKCRAQFAANMLKYEQESYDGMGLADYGKIILFAYVRAGINWLFNRFGGHNYDTCVDHDHIFQRPLPPKQLERRRNLELVDERLARRGEILRYHRSQLDARRGKRGPVIVTTPQEAINEHLREQEEADGDGVQVRYSFDGVNVYRS